MKKRFLIIFVLLMLLGFVTACNQPTCQHVDADDDLKCDLCGEAYDDGEEKPADEYDIKITSVSEPAFVSTWKINKSEQVNKETEFAILSEEYLVGDDNGFRFKPTVMFVAIPTTSKVPSRFKSSLIPTKCS